MSSIAEVIHPRLPKRPCKALEHGSYLPAFTSYHLLLLQLRSSFRLHAFLFSCVFVLVMLTPPDGSSFFSSVCESPVHPLGPGSCLTSSTRST